jgi:hypothetical protein
MTDASFTGLLAMLACHAFCLQKILVTAVGAAEIHLRSQHECAALGVG